MNKDCAINFILKNRNRNAGAEVFCTDIHFEDR